MADSLGHQANLCVDTVVPIDVSSIPIKWLSEGIQEQAQIIDDEYMTGSRFKDSAFTRKGLQPARGSVEIPCTPAYLAFFAPFILGGTQSPAGTFNCGESLSSFVGMIDKVVDAYLMEGIYINRCTLQGSSGQRMRLALDLMMLDWTPGQTFPSLTLPKTAQYVPLVFPADSVLTLGNTARRMRDIEIVVDNRLEEDFRNGVLPDSIDPIDKCQMTLRANIVWNSTNESDLYRPSTNIWQVDDNDLTLTNGTVSVQINMDALQIAPLTPTVSSLGRIPFNLQANITIGEGTQPMSWVIDSTP
jgi:hypothetical protein